jgi:recombinational DNA repair protein (RecF pathway)
VFLRSRRSDLHLLHDCYLVTPHVALRSAAARLATASYACELVELATAAEDANPAVFELLARMLTELEEDTGAAGLIWFELQLLTVGGWARRWDAPTGTDRVLQSLAGGSLAGARRVRLSAAQVAACRECLSRVWEAELGRTPRSRPWVPG